MRNVTLSAIVVTILAGVTGCAASPTVFEVGDCLKTSVDQDGKAVKTDCSDEKSFEVTMLAKNGGRPNCPYYVVPGHPMWGGAAYLTDAMSRVTYCGIHNGPY